MLISKQEMAFPVSRRLCGRSQLAIAPALRPAEGGMAPILSQLFQISFFLPNSHAVVSSTQGGYYLSLVIGAYRDRCHAPRVLNLRTAGLPPGDSDGQEGYTQCNRLCYHQLGCNDKRIQEKGGELWNHEAHA